MKPHHALFIISLLVACYSCRSTKRIESTTADTIRIEQSFERFALKHDSSSVATSTHNEHYAYVVERITIDSSGKVLRRDIERGKYSARQADTTSTTHNVTRVIADSTKVANETHTTKKNEAIAQKKWSMKEIGKIFWTFALIVGIIVMCITFLGWKNLKLKK